MEQKRNEAWEKLKYDDNEFIPFLEKLNDEQKNTFDAAAKIGQAVPEGLTFGIRLEEDLWYEDYLGLIEYLKTVGLSPEIGLEGAMTQTGMAAVDALAQGFGDSEGKVASSAQGMLDSMLAVASAMVPPLTGVFAMMTSEMDTTVNTGTDTMRTDFNTELQGMADDASGQGKSVVEGFSDGIQSNLPLIVTAVQMMTNLAVSVANKTLEINSPSKVFTRIGESTTEGLASGIENTAPTAADAIENVAVGLRDAMIAAEETIQAELTAYDKEAIARREEESLKAYEDAIADKYQSITDAEINASEKKDEAIKKHNESRQKLIDKMNKAEAKDRQEFLNDLIKLDAEHAQELRDIDTEYVDYREDTLDDIHQMELDHNDEMQREAEQAAYDKLQAQKAAIEDYRKEYESALDDIARKEQSITDKLIGNFELLERTTEKVGDKEIEIVGLRDLQPEIDQMIELGDLITGLQGRGLPDQILEEISGMGLEEALETSREYMKLSDDEFANYLTLWEQRDEAAADLAAKFVEDEYAALDKAFIENLPEGFTSIEELFNSLGEDGVTQFLEGLQAGGQEIDIPAILSSLGAKEAAKETGTDIGDGLTEGITETDPLVSTALQTVTDNIKSVLDEAFPIIYLQYSDFLNSILALTEAFANSMQESIHTMACSIIDTLNMLPDSSYSYPAMPEPIVIPRLARGGIVDSATIAMIGEKGREAVVPLSQNAEWMTPFRDMQDTLAHQNALLQQLIDKDANVYMDGREVGTVVAPHVDNWQSRRGVKIGANSAFTNTY